MEMNPTEKLSDAELLIANARARTRALKYEYLTAEEQLWRDLAAYLEKAIADLTARNDTIARVRDEIAQYVDQWARRWPVSNEYVLQRMMELRADLALTPTQPEASEPAATADEPHALGCDCEYCFVKRRPAPPDSPERCAWDDAVGRQCLLAKDHTGFHQRDCDQPPTAPPETRDAARERLERGAVYALRNAVMRNISHQADGKEFTLAIDALANYIEARAAAAGGKRNE